jgi:phage replication O-like protein O
MPGFTKFENQLLEKVLTSQLTKRQLKILLLVIRFSVGYQKDYAVIRQSDFEFAGLSRSCIADELKKLSALRVIQWDIKRSLIWVNPNLQQWRVKATVTSRSKFYKIAAKNSPKWQQSILRNGNILVAETAAPDKERKRNTNKVKEHVFSEIIEMYFIQIAPLSAEEALILKEVIPCYGVRVVKHVISQMSNNNQRSFSVFLKTLDGEGTRTRSGNLSHLRSSLKRYAKVLPES